MLEKMIPYHHVVWSYLASIRLRYVVMAPNRKITPTMTSRQYDKSVIFVSGDDRCQDGDAIDLNKLGRQTFFLQFSYLSLKCERHNTSQNTTREKWCTLRKSRISCRSSLGSLEQLLSFVRMALRHDCNV